MLEESATQIPSLTKNDAMFFVGLQTVNRRFQSLHTISKGTETIDCAISTVAQQILLSIDIHTT